MEWKEIKTHMRGIPSSQVLLLGTVMLLLGGFWILLHLPHQQQWQTVVQGQGQGSGLVGQISPQQGALRIQWRCQQADTLWLLLDSDQGMQAHYHEPCSPKGAALLVTLPGTVYLAASSKSPWVVQVLRAT